MNSKSFVSTIVFLLLVLVRPLATPAQAQLPARQSPTLEDALRMLEGAKAAAAKMGVGVTCAVVDGRGDLVALARMDGVAFFTADVARGKAVASALLGQPSAALGPMTTVLASVNSVAHTDMLPIQGALPIARNNQTVGAIGCSGATSQQDEDAARAGVETK